MGPESQILKRLDEHALRPAPGADGLQPSLADPVVDRPPRHVQQLRRLIDRHAAPEAWLDHLRVEIDG